MITTRTIPSQSQLPHHRPGVHPLDPIENLHEQADRGRDGREIQTVSTDIHFIGSDKIGKVPCSEMDNNAYLDSYANDNVRTIPEVERCSADRTELDLAPLNTRAETDLGERIAMSGLKNGKGVLPSAVSPAAGAH